jgi:hypothetical protein
MQTGALVPALYGAEAGYFLQHLFRLLGARIVAAKFHENVTEA